MGEPHVAFARGVGGSLRPHDVLFLAQRDTQEIAAERVGKVEIGGDIAQSHRPFVGVFGDREVAGHHGHGDAALAQEVRRRGDLAARGVDADLRGPHAKRVIAAGRGDLSKRRERQRRFAFGEVPFADAYGKGEFHGKRLVPILQAVKVANLPRQVGKSLI